MKTAPFIPITRKVNFIIVVSLVLGIGSITFYFARSLFLTIDNSTKGNLNQQSEILHTSITNFMLPGEAPLAVNFFNQIRTVNPNYEITLYRRNGKKAFSDNETIQTVNRNIGREKFALRAVQESPTPAPASTQFDAATGKPPHTVFFQQSENDRVLFRIYKPLINLPKCTGCHGSDHTVRGVIDIRSDVSQAFKTQQNTLYISIGLFAGMVFLLAFFLARFLQRNIIVPIKVIGSVCDSVTKGMFDAHVSIKNRDEIGILGHTVNSMVEGLRERFELSKFVSTSTIRSLKNNEKGKKLSVTLFFSDIRGFTSFSEKRDPEKVVEYLNAVLNVQTEIIHKYGGDIDKYVGDAVLALFTGEDSAERACRSAVEIQKDFERNSAKQYSGLVIGIGINCGDVILGMIGSEKRADFTVIGDTVNTASRLCSAAKAGQILISRNIFKDVSTLVAADGPYRLRIRGKDRYEGVYILKGIL